LILYKEQIKKLESKNSSQTEANPKINQNYQDLESNYKDIIEKFEVLATEYKKLSNEVH
jgi:hypothetical protein